jgi:integrase
MENDGKSKYTIESTRKSLRYLSQHADLNEPEQVKQFIARHECTNGRKRNLAIAYGRYATYYNIAWQTPKYEPDPRQIRTPTKEKVEMLIANAGRRMATKLQISMETGIRPIELCNLKVKDIDLEQRLIYPTTAKHGNARTLKISLILQNMLMDYIARDKLKPEDKLFNTNARGYSKMFRMTRNALAKKLHDPTLKQIRLYDFRHFFATNLYHKTRDLLLVMNQLGHKNIENTLIYTQLINLEEEEWTCKTANNVTEAKSLIEDGFEYVQEMNGISLYRKRK